MRAIVLENDPIDLVPKPVMKMAKSLVKDPEIIANFGLQLRRDPEKMVSTFMGLESGDALVMQHVFITWSLLEKMIDLLLTLKARGKKIRVYLVNSMLEDELFKYIKEHRDPDLTSWQTGKGKVKELIEVLEYHKVYDLLGFIFEGKEVSKRITHKVLTKRVALEIEKCNHYMTEVRCNEHFCSMCGKKKKVA